MLVLLNVLIMVIYMGNEKSWVFMRTWIMKPALFSSIVIFIPKVLCKFEIFWNGLLAMHTSFRRLALPLGCLSPIHVLLMQDYVVKKNWWNLMPRPGKNWSDLKTRPEPARKFWALNTIFLTRIRNKSNLKNRQIFASHPTWSQTHLLNSNIISLLFIFL